MFCVLIGIHKGMCAVARVCSIVERVVCGVKLMTQVIMARVEHHLCLVNWRSFGIHNVLLINRDPGRYKGAYLSQDITLELMTRPIDVQYWILSASILGRVSRVVSIAVLMQCLQIRADQN